MTTDGVRLARVEDAPRLAELHCTRISEGFLASLGPRFLARLYRRVVRSRDAFAVVVERDDAVVGFCAAASDVRRFYLEFLVRDGVFAALSAPLQIVRATPRVVETLRYPAATGDLPHAEVLAVATDAGVAGQGLGGALVRAATDRLQTRGCPEVKVVLGATNERAQRMYARGGFVRRADITIHEGVHSEVLVWTRS